jgi:hypothetical protein
MSYNPLLMPTLTAFHRGNPCSCHALAGRTTLTKSTLSAIPIHVSIAVTIDPWILRAMDKIRGDFIWTGTDTTLGGQCLVAWSKVARPVELGGLGVLDLTTLGYSLRLR